MRRDNEQYAARLEGWEAARLRPNLILIPILTCTVRRYNEQYAARLEGWEAARLRDLAAHTASARRAFASAGGAALAQQLAERARRADRVL